MEVAMTTKPKKPKGKMYFTQDTEDAIVKYNQSLDPFERDAVFREEIYPALDKLAENVINRFKFPYIKHTFEDIKNQVVSFIVLNLHKFDHTRGKKAFSYFSVVAKHYLILQNDNAYREELRNVDLTNDMGEDTFVEEEILTSKQLTPTAQSDARDFMSLLIQFWDYNLTKIFKKKRDIDIATAVVELMRRSNSIENFNKKALYVMIREMTNSKTVHITKVINKMKEHTVEQMKEYRRTGHLSDPSMYFVYKQDS